MASDSKPRDRLLNYEQVADRLGYTTETVRNKVNEGDLPFTKIKLNDARSGAVRFRESEIEAWIEERAAGSDAA